MSKPILPAILSCNGYQLSDEEKKLFNTIHPAGINLFSRNIKDPQQLQALIQSIYQTIESNDILIAIDQEGGRVRRLTDTFYHSTAAAIDIGTLPIDKALRAAYLHAEITSYDMLKSHLNTNYAPVLDIIHADTTPALKSRCFNSDPQIVTLLAQKMIETYIKNGIAPCIKHLPGHGRAISDPHLNLPIISASIKELEKDFYPFQQLNNSPFGMTAHIIIEAIDPLYPATQSSKVINNIIRQHIGFDGLLISDAIDMHALKGSIAEKALNSLQAGCDIICYAGGNINELKQIAASCHPMSDKSLERFAKVKKITYHKKNIDDIASLYDEYQSLLSAIYPYQDKYDATEVLNIMNNTKFN